MALRARTHTHQIQAQPASQLVRRSVRAESKMLFFVRFTFEYNNIRSGVGPKPNNCGVQRRLCLPASNRETKPKTRSAECHPYTDAGDPICGV